MTNIIRCPVCNSEKKLKIFDVASYPYFTSPVDKNDKKAILRKYKSAELRGRLQPVLCQNCSHIYLFKLPNEKIMSELYGQYYSYPSALEGSFIPERDNTFLKIFDKKIRSRLTKSQNSILEIGCFDGYVLYNLKKRGNEVTGCDPSEGACIGNRFGVNIKQRFFNIEDFIKEGLSYDIIIFRHLLEHLSGPKDFLKQISKILKPNGFIIFEVPNIIYHLRNVSTAVFGFQHLQYFSKKSISELFRGVNLRLVSIIDTGENLITISTTGKFKKSNYKSVAKSASCAFQKKIDTQKKRFHELLAKFSKEGIILWGAGGACTNLLEIFDAPKDSVRLIVDSDSKKWNTEFLKYHIPIDSPEALSKFNHGCLVVCSMYSKEIIAKLRKSKYDKPVINMYPRMEMSRLNEMA